MGGKNYYNLRTYDSSYAPTETPTISRVQESRVRQIHFYYSQMTITHHIRWLSDLFFGFTCTFRGTEAYIFIDISLQTPLGNLCYMSNTSQGDSF